MRSNDTAEDLVQDVFWRVWRRWHQVDTGTNLRAYLFTATRTRALDHLASTSADVRRREQYAAPSEPALPSDDEYSLSTEQISRAIQLVIETLPARQREVAVLRLQQQMSTTAIAVRLGILAAHGRSPHGKRYAGTERSTSVAVGVSLTLERAA